MRITYRDKTNKGYWTKRWSDIEADEPMENEGKYPLKYSILTIKENFLVLYNGSNRSNVVGFMLTCVSIQSISPSMPGTRSFW